MAGWTASQQHLGPPLPNYIVTDSLGSANKHSRQRHFFLSLFFTFTSLFNVILFIYLVLAALGLHCCAGSLVAVSEGYSLVAVHRLLSLQSTSSGEGFGTCGEWA